MGLYASFQYNSQSTQIAVVNDGQHSTLIFPGKAEVYFQNQTGAETTFVFSDPSYFEGSPTDTGPLKPHGSKSNSKTYRVSGKKTSTIIHGAGTYNGVWQDIDYGTLDPSDGDGKPDKP